MKRLNVVLCLLAVAACSDGHSASDQASPSALVTLAKATEGPITESVTLYGATEAGPAGKQVLVAQADSIVTEIVAPAGGKVSKGDEIAILSPAPTPSLDLAKARADAKAADAAYARAGRLRADGLASDADVESALAAAESANATLNSLEGRVGALTLRAPAEGYVSEFVVKAGDQVAAGAPVATIVQQAGMRARFGADPIVARALKPGMPMTLRPSASQGSFLGLPAAAAIDPPGAPAPADAAYAAKIQSIDPVVDPQTQLASVFADLPSFADVAIGEALICRVTVGRDEHAVIIPYTALLNDGGQPFVYVVESGVAHRHDVALGPVNSDRAAIRNGVKPGDEVITEGGTGVEDGMKVRIK